MPLPTSLKRKLLRNLPETIHRATKILPASATEDLFRINDGPILVHALFGRVTTALSATATSASLNLDPIVGSAVIIATATVVTSDVINTIWGIPAAVAGALAASGIVAADEVLATGGWILTEGDITLTTTAINTGVVEWYLRWSPIHPSASVEVL